ncbi:hypothetical protein [Bacillus sp. FJAT-22090]|uniref:hypothetical protein n=1 Tax=Bacillus sp. FJAT-22090 TaxID=1581038 RepID=UPI00119DC91F|nr:hypothetical protein [Bacillus sp. FJAT-22090]
MNNYNQTEDNFDFHEEHIYLTFKDGEVDGAYHSEDSAFSHCSRNESRDIFVDDNNTINRIYKAIYVKKF